MPTLNASLPWLGLLLLTFGIASAQSDKTPAASPLERARAAYAAGQYKDAEDRLTRWLKSNAKAAEAEEAMVLQADAQVRQGRYETAAKTVQRFRKAYSSSVYMPRMAYVQGLAHIRNGRNAEASKALLAALRGARTEAFREEAALALRAIGEKGGLHPDEMRVVFEGLQGDPQLGPYWLERLADELQKAGKFGAAKQAYEDYLKRYSRAEGAGRVRDRLEAARALAAQRRSVLVMGPMTGDYAEVGRSLKEGAALAFEEARIKTGLPVEIATLDDVGNMVLGVQRLRKVMQQEPIDAIIGPAMSDVSAAVAVDLSARQSKVPMISPTATTDGIAALGEGVFQLNVTTLTLGQTIGAHAVDCMKLRDFGVVAPKTEYGYQLAEAFTAEVEQRGGKVLVTQYYDPEASDLGDFMAGLRKEVHRVYFEARQAEGIPDPEPKVIRSYLNDSVLSLDAFFVPAGHGEEAYRVASQIQFSRLRGQFLGSSGWFDKAVLMKTSPIAHGVVFSVDFPDNPKTETYAAFARSYQAKYKRTPDRVAALSYDAARLMAEAMVKSPKADDLIENLKEVKRFEGILGPIVFDAHSGANQSANLMRVDKKIFKDAPGCAETQATATKNTP